MNRLGGLIPLLCGLMFLAGGLFALCDAATLIQARNWPLIMAHVDSCSITRRYGKTSSWWEVTAKFSYNAGFFGEYEETWTPPDSPRYPRSRIDPAISASDINALTTRYCNRAATQGIRVSTLFPNIAWRNEAIAQHEWKTNLWTGLGMSIVGALSFAGGLSILRGTSPNVKRAGTRARVRGR